MESARSRKRPLVIGYHLIWTIYGAWLPNDPRGSGSHTIRNSVLEQLGEIHHGRKVVQPAGWEIQEFYSRAVPLLKHPVVPFDSRMIGVVGRAFGDLVESRKYTCYACAIMPDHVHLVIRKHRDQAEEMIEALQVRSRELLHQEKLIDGDHPVWGGPGWKVFLDEPGDIWRTIDYVRSNPRELQEWGFVKVYDNWPFHEGHDVNSPYARGLRGR